MYMHKIGIDLAGIFAWALIVAAVSIIFDLLIKIIFREKTQND